ncbi:MAG TPA: chromosome segregation protein ParM, partial [Allocoleopsis sp.]
EAVNRPPGQRFYRPRGATRPTDLDTILPSLKKSFARELSNRLIAWLPERVTDVIVSGGGGEFFWSEFQPLLEEAQLRIHLAQPSRKANALGQYLYGRTQLATLSPQLTQV